MEEVLGQVVHPILLQEWVELEVRGQHPVVVEMVEMVEMVILPLVEVVVEEQEDIQELVELVDMDMLAKQLPKEQVALDREVEEVEVEV